MLSQKFFGFFVFISLVGTSIAYDAYLNSYMNTGWPDSSDVPSEDAVIESLVAELHNLDSVSDLDGCTKCKTRLEIGKFVALTKPDIVHDAFIRWCIESGHDEEKCVLNYGPNCHYDSATGSDFLRVLQLMQPSGYDGDYFCYFHDPKCDVLPITPDIDLSSWWPKKPREYEPPVSCGETFNVLHISDLDIQLSYKIASESNCSQATCCSSYSYNEEAPSNSYDYASFHDPSHHLSFYASSYYRGFFDKGPYVDIYNRDSSNWLPAHEFGAYTCDAPELLINNSLTIMRDFHDHHLNFEFSIFTGGVVDHTDREYLTHKQVLESESKAYRDMKQFLGDIPVFPVVGTRDSFPTNQLAPKVSGNAKMFTWNDNFLADVWNKNEWIDLDTSKQVRYSQGSYSTTTARGLKIISLNSNIWNYKNLYAYTNTTSVDLFGQFKFLVDELIESEENCQRVWIIAHLPLSKDSLPIPAKVFAQIIERFSPKIIAGIFFGHKHKDQFNILYASDATNPKDVGDALNFAWIAPSISPYSGLNPAWRYYAVDSSSFSIMNSFTYYTKLNNTFINDGAEPVWEFEYSAREAYDPQRLWPADRPLDTEFWHHAAEKIRDDFQINQMYTDFAYRNSPFTPLCESDSECDDNFCEVTSFTVDNRKQCMITEDQDDYCVPGERVDYIPLLKPYSPPEYQVIDDCDEDATATEVTNESVLNENNEGVLNENNESFIDGFEDVKTDDNVVEGSNQNDSISSGSIPDEVSGEAESDSSTVSDESGVIEEPSTLQESPSKDMSEKSIAETPESVTDITENNVESIKSENKSELGSDPVDKESTSSSKSPNHPDFGIQSEENIRQRIHRGYREVTDQLKNLAH